jgi:hypothetical protein
MINMIEFENDIRKYPFLCCEILRKVYNNLSKHDKYVLLFTLTNDIDILREKK